MSQPRPKAEALAVTSIVMGGATGTPVVSNTSVKNVQGHTNSQEHHGRPGIGIETVKGVKTREPLTPTLPGESEAFTGFLPISINVNSLERVLVDHPDCLFVSRLCNSHKYGPDIRYKGPRVPQVFSDLTNSIRSA